jgi:hypothetical protein
MGQLIENALMVCLLLGVIYSVCCRLLAMRPGPASRAAAVQHIALGTSAAAALICPYPGGALSVGLFLFMLIGARRWKNGRAPGALGGTDAAT